LQQLTTGQTYPETSLHPETVGWCGIEIGKKHATTEGTGSGMCVIITKRGKAGMGELRVTTGGSNSNSPKYRKQGGYLGFAEKLNLFSQD